MDLSLIGSLNKNSVVLLNEFPFCAAKIIHVCRWAMKQQSANIDWKLARLGTCKSIVVALCS